MDFQISPNLKKELKKIKAKNPQLVRKVEKQLNLFQLNHLHPSLRLHKLSGNLENLWSIAIDSNFRMLFVFDDHSAYFFDTGTHNQVYKK